MSAILTFGYDDAAVRSGLDGLQNRLRSAKVSAEKDLTLGARVDGSSLNALGSSIAELASLLGGAISVGALKGVIDEFDRLGDLSARLGVTAESIQRVNRQAKLSGTDVEAAVSALTKLRRNLEAGGDDKTKQALEDIGVSAETLLSLAPDQQIIYLADAFQVAQANGTGFAATQALLGKGFVELLPLLRTSREELEKLASGPVVSDAAIARLQAFNDDLDSFVNVAKTATAVSVDFLGTRLQAGLGSIFNGGTFDSNLKDIQDKGQAEADEKKAQADKQRALDAESATREAASQRQSDAAKIALSNEDKKAALAFEALSTAEKLRAVYQQIAEVNIKAESLKGGDDPVAAAKLQSDLIELLAKATGLKKQAADEAERDAKAAQNAADAVTRQNDRRNDALGDIKERIAILDAEAAGNDKLAQQLRDEADLRQRVQGLIAAGVDPAQATTLAVREQQAAQAAAEQKAGESGEQRRGRIKGGVSGTAENEAKIKAFGGLDSFLQDRQTPLKDTFQFPGLDALKANQPGNKPVNPLKAQNAANNAAQAVPNQQISITEGAQIVALLTSLDAKLNIT